jgi:AcrR family transcriptional regulator
VNARDRILETAATLFYAQGYRAVGIDTIIKASGVAKMTLYKHFPSKDDLIAAYLTRANAGFWTWLDGIAAQHPDPRAQLEATFDGVAKLASSAQCLGCAFAQAAGEFPDADHPGHLVALTHKREVLARLEALTRALPARDPVGLAQDLMLVMDGAWMAARMFGGGNHARRAGETARALIAAQVD